MVRSRSRGNVLYDLACGKDFVYAAVYNAPMHKSAIWKMSKDSLKLLQTIPLPERAKSLAYTDDTLWVALGSDTIWKIRTEDGTVVAKISVVEPKVLVADGSNVWVGQGTGSITQIGQDGAISRFFQVSDTEVTGLAVSQRTIWVAIESKNTVIWLDHSTMEPVARHNLLTPRRMAYDGSSIWVITEEGMVVSFDASTYRKIKSYEVGIELSRVAIGEEHIFVLGGLVPKVLMVNKNTGNVLGLVHESSHPMSVSWAGDSVWVTYQFGDTNGIIRKTIIPGAE